MAVRTKRRAFSLPRAFTLVVSALVMLSFGETVRAACTSPDANLGSLDFQSGSFKYCDGSNWLPLGSASFPLWGSSGTAASPTYSFSAGTNTGMFMNGAGTLAFATGGSTRMVIDSSGRLGIGTLQPSRDLHVVAGSGLFEATSSGGTALGLTVGNPHTSSSGPGIRIELDTGGLSRAYIIGGADGAASAGYLAFSTRDSTPLERMRIDSSGDVGIGTTNAASGARLDVRVGAIAAGSQSSTLGGEVRWYETGTGTNYVGFRAPANLTADTNLHWDNGNKRLGIGNAFPTSRMHVEYSAGNLLRLARSTSTAGDDAQIEFGLVNAAAGWKNYSMISGGITNNTTGLENGFFQVSTMRTGTLTEALRVASTGNVGIGTPGPTQKLEVSGNIRASGSIATGSQVITSGATSTLDFNNGNTISSNYLCGGGNITLANIRDGGTYLYVNTDTGGTAQCNFNTATTGTDAATVSFRFKPANAARTSSSHTIYRLTRVGTVVYVEWSSGL